MSVKELDLINCPLCLDPHPKWYYRDKRREYYSCSICDLVFVPALQHQSAHDEKDDYLKHENDPESLGYRTFLKKLMDPLLGFLETGMTGLDFGSGPGPTLNLLLKEAGFPCQNYDPYFANVLERLQHQYDFLTATEVVEHFNRPRLTWRTMVSLLKSRGLLGIMTMRHDLVQDFSKWWYIRESSHIMFYSLKTWQWIAQQYNLELAYYDERVAIFKRL